ncbi:hypothetical protein OG21DRAFT_1604796 [Imleria badia]|nr:hypothetical protein OG21DRAFT_1604796 [Imleria badia]
MFFRLSFVTLIFAAVALGTPVKRDAAEVVEDIQKVDAQTKSLDELIQAFPNSGGTLPEVYAIHEAGVKVEGTLLTATNDASASSDFTDAQSNTNLAELRILASDVKETLANLVTKEPAVSKMGAAPIAESDLQNLKAATDALYKALYPKMQPDTQSALKELFSDTDAEFSNAIKAYSS